MAKLSHEQIFILSQYRNILNFNIERISKSAAVASAQISDMTELKYLMAIIIGSEFVKAAIKNIILLHDYIKELEEIIATNNSSKIRPITEDYNDMPLGTILHKEFKGKYSEEKILFDEIQSLNKERNRAVHHAVFDYVGDLQKVDEDLKNYVRTDPIKKLLDKLIDLFNREAEKIKNLEEKIKQMGLM